MLTLVNLSGDAKIAEIMVKTKIVNTLLQIIFNIMKLSDTLTLQKNSKLLVESEVTKTKGNQPNHPKKVTKKITKIEKI